MVPPIPKRLRAVVSAFAVALLATVVVTGSALAQTPPPTTGGAVYTPPPPPAEKAQVVDGRAIPPISAPPRVVAAIEAANLIVGKPYRMGGGHRLFSSKLDSAYDCSGSVSQALHGGKFVHTPLDSSSFMGWGQRGTGQWITVYTKASHAYVVIAGLRFDTSMRDPDAPGTTGPAWSTSLRESGNYVARHPRGY